MSNTLYIPELTQKEKIARVLKCQCLNCGGHLETRDKIRYICQYCGTQYSVKQDEIQPQHFILKVAEPHIITLGGVFFRGRHMEKAYGKELSTKLLKDDIVQTFSDYIREHFDELIDIEEDEMPWQDGTTYRAAMRVAEKIGWI